MLCRPALATLLLALPLAAQEPGPVVFSELMWMGSSASSADEWIELFNRSDGEIDLSGWTIARQSSSGEDTMLVIEEGRIAPGATFLIANYASHNSQLAVEPDLVTAAVSLPNTRLLLRLYDSAGQEVDSADDGRGAPAAGDAQLKQAMVRLRLDGDGGLATSWETASEALGWDEGASERGTPGTLPERLLPAAEATEPTAVHPAAWAQIKGQRRPH